MCLLSGKPCSFASERTCATRCYSIPRSIIPIQFPHAATLLQVTLHEVCRCLRVNDIAWLPSSPNGRIDQQQQLLRQRWGWSVFGWMLRHLAFPLVRSHFFVTETKESGSRMYAAARHSLYLGNTFIGLFVRKPVWAALRCTFMSQSRLQSLYTPVSKAERRGDSHQCRPVMRLTSLPAGNLKASSFGWSRVFLRCHRVLAFVTLNLGSFQASRVGNAPNSKSQPSPQAQRVCDVLFLQESSLTATGTLWPSIES